MTISSFARRLQVPQTEEEAEIWQTNRWLNRDNVPLPESRRTWGKLSFVGYWLTIGLNITGWTAGSALLSLGLTVPQALGAAIIGNILIALAVVATGMLGAKWHVGFPMWNRIVWGMWGSYFPLVNRIILSFTWASTQAWFGGQCIKVMLGAMAPSIYTMPNVFPASSHLTSVDFLCFILFLAVQSALVWVPPERFKRMFLVISATSTVTVLSIFFWALARAKGAGPLIDSSKTFAVTGVQPVTGSALGWAMVRAISSTLGSWCAGILNMSDYARFARRPSDPVLSQLIIVPLFTISTCVIGIITTSCAAQIFPDAGLLWAPYDLLTAIQNAGNSGTRAAVFFAGLAFVMSQIGINIPCNAISGGIDLASMFPKYINIKRGAYITTFMSLPMCPWALVSGATVFISVMSGYATFLAPMTGIMLADYIVVRRQNVKLSGLYECHPGAPYYYWKGVNLRAAAAWVLAVIPSFPGFLASVSTTQVPDALHKIYYLCWPLGFTLGGGLYILFATIFPIANRFEVDDKDVYGTFGPAEIDTKLEEPIVEEKDDKNFATTTAVLV